jgi:hypothetical protein
VSASLVAPDHVARRINDFADAVQVLLDAAAARNSIEDPMTLDEIRRATSSGAKAQVTLVNAMRESLGMREPLTVPIGGVPVHSLCGWKCRLSENEGADVRVHMEQDAPPYYLDDLASTALVKLSHPCTAVG